MLSYTQYHFETFLPHQTSRQIPIYSLLIYTYLSTWLINSTEKHLNHIRQKEIL